MATKKELERKIRKQDEELRRQNKELERLRIQLGMLGVRACREAAKAKRFSQS